jgi:hypothetical protein
MNNNWPAVEPTNSDDCLIQLVRLAQLGQASAYHGAYQNCGYILSSLDLLFKEKNILPADRLKLETKLLENFVQETDPLLPPGARRHIEFSYLKRNSFRNTGTLYVGRHYGLPTRCVDWTSNPLTGLFFACRRKFDEDGVVWWMNEDKFLKQVAEQWPKFYKKKSNVEDHIEKDFINGNEQNILTPLYYPKWMERPIMQAAWITLALRYDVRHDEAIHGLDLRQCGRIIIKAALKRDLLNKLSRLGVVGASLGIGDECVETIRAGVVKKLF